MLPYSLPLCTVGGWPHVDVGGAAPGPYCLDPADRAAFSLFACQVLGPAELRHPVRLLLTASLVHRYVEVLERHPASDWNELRSEIRLLSQGLQQLRESSSAPSSRKRPRHQDPASDESEQSSAEGTPSLQLTKAPTRPGAVARQRAAIGTSEGLYKRLTGITRGAGWTGRPCMACCRMCFRCKPRSRCW